MPDTPEPRSTSAADRKRLAFARYVDRALEHATKRPGSTVVKLLKDTGVSRATVYRWRAANWERAPKPEQVVAFCRALGLDPAEPFRILGWTNERPSTAPPIPPTIEALLRKLADPKVTDTEKDDILRTVEWLATRPTLTPPRRKPRQDIG